LRITGPDLRNWAWEILDRDERRRADRFRFETLRTRFILAHGFLRDVLAGYLDADVSKIVFRIDDYGKPHLIDRRLQFNLSRSSALAVVAVTTERRIGVDIEQIRPLKDPEAIAHELFAGPEGASLAALPPRERMGAFFACWVRKEAYIKALGRGLSIPLDCFDTTFDLGRSGQLIRSPNGAAEPALWWLSDLPPIEGYAGAVAVEAEQGG
jgi:4'-phosphopantetheinyl transferase